MSHWIVFSLVLALSAFSTVAEEGAQTGKQAKLSMANPAGHVG